MKIKKGDKVRVISGKDKGKTGVVLRAFPREDSVIVEGAALYKRHMKGSSGKVGRIIEKSRPTHVSNVVLVSTQKKAKSVLESKK
ncbi:MAG TPA: 50S ribosomal protein L24 [Candidatus Paceibacterota bacterium]